MVARSLVIVVVILALAPALRSNEPEDALARLEAWTAKTKDVRTLTAKFEQTRRMKIFTEPIVSKGTVTMKLEQGRTTILWHTTDPEEGFTRITSTQVLTYIPSLKSAEEINLGEAQEPFARLLLGPVLPSTLEQDFEVARIILGQTEPCGIEEFRLVPRSDSVRRLLTSVTIMLDTNSGIVRQFVTQDPSGDSLTVALTDVSLNPELPPNALDVPIPPDVTVSRPLDSKDPK